MRPLSLERLYVYTANLRVRTYIPITVKSCMFFLCMLEHARSLEDSLTQTKRSTPIKVIIAIIMFFLIYACLGGLANSALTLTNPTKFCKNAN